MKLKDIDFHLQGSELIVDKRPFLNINMKDLPHRLSIEAAKMVEIEDGLAFQSKHAPLLNLYLCDIKIRDKI